MFLWEDSELTRVKLAGSFCRLQPAKRTPLKPSHTKSPTHNELRTRRPMW